MTDRNKKARVKLKDKTRKKILIYGPAPHISTGNGKLVRHMALGLMKAGHQVYTIGVDYNSIQMFHENINILPGFMCEHCGDKHMGETEHVKKIADYITLFRPVDYFICVGDPIKYQQLGMGKIQPKIQTKLIMYATLDSDGYWTNQLYEKNGLPDYLDICDKVVSVAKFTQDQLKKWKDIDSDLIYETIDTNNYHPINSEQKKELRKKYRFKEKDFVIYYSGRNILRKRHDTLLEACAKFLCETKDTYLYLNIPMTESKKRFFYPNTLNPIDFIQRVMKKKHGRDLIKEGRVIFVARGELGAIGINEQQNAGLYQIADVYATASSAEGFGLCPVEAMSCGVPTIIPDFTTGRELLGIDLKQEINSDKFDEYRFTIGQGGLLVPTPITLNVGNGLKQKLTRPEDIYYALNHLYNNLELRTKLGKQGRDYVMKTFNQEIFGQKWLDVVMNTQKKVIEEPKQEEGEGFKAMEMDIKQKEDKKGEK